MWLVPLLLTRNTLSTYPANIYLFKVNNKIIRKRPEICSKRQHRRSGVFIVNFEHILHLFLVFLLLTLSK